MNWLPKTKIGKISFWIGISAFVLVYLQYWIAMIFQASISPWIGLVPMACELGAGIGSFIAIIKYRERAILIFVTAIIGVLGLLFVMGELLLPLLFPSLAH